MRRGGVRQAPKRIAMRPGFTLVEMLVAMVVFAGLIAIAIPLFTSQVRAFTVGTERAELTLSGEFASSTLTRQLRTAGTNTLAQQPWLVYGDSNVIAFHADLVSRVADPFAVYIDPDAPTDIVQTLPTANKYQLPQTTFSYPDVTYQSAPGVLSPAELVIFWFEPDTSTARTDDFVLWHRVNDAAAEIIARRMLRTGTQPFFQYMKSVADTMLQEVPSGQLPLRHTVAIHLAAADAAAPIDSVRAVRFAFTTTNGRTGTAERRLDHTDIVWFRNGSLAKQRTCGDTPIFTSTVTATPEVVNDKAVVRIQWDAALDETSGEHDVIRYVLWRTSPLSMPGDPLLSIPPGAASYEYVDTDVQPDQQWIYSVAAQDCTPTMSASIVSGTVVVLTPTPLP